MADFDSYKDKYETIRLRRSASGILEMVLHTEGGPYQYDARAGSDVPAREMNSALLNIARDPGNKIVILSGTGSEYSGPAATPQTMSRGDTRHWEKIQGHGIHMLMDLLDIPALMISCINGPALRHAEIPLLADIVLASSEATIQDSAHFPNRMVPGDGIAFILPHLIGWNRGRYFHLTGQSLDASQLLELGLVSEVMQRDKLLPRAWELAEQLVESNPLVLRYTRALFTSHLRARLREHMELGLALEALAAVDESFFHKE